MAYDDSSVENVAHTKWRQRGADRLKQQYERGASKIGFVLSIVEALVQALLSPEDEADWWTLADLFPVVMDEAHLMAAARYVALNPVRAATLGST